MMFEKMLQWLRRMLGSYFDGGSGAASDIIISSEMEARLSGWVRMYEGAPIKEDVPSIGLGAAICAEFARLVTMENEITITGSVRADFLSAQLTQLDLSKTVELACALGGVILKPYVSGDRIAIDVIQADCFYPIAFNTSGRMTGAIFADQIRRKNKLYTRLEKHEFVDGTHSIENIAFESGNAASLGSEISLEAVPEWADIAPYMEFTGCDRPLFAYFKMPFANTVDRHSPLGVSVFSRATGLIQDADEQYGRYVWEYVGGELAVDVTADYLKPTPGGGANLPKGKERLFRGRDYRTTDFYQVFAPALRDESIKRGFNTMLQRIEFACGLAYGTLSDPQNVEKTAEEIRSSRQRSYATVHAIQVCAEAALSDLLYAMDRMATVYRICPEGSYAVAFDWDDSVLNDPAQRKAQFWQYVTAGRFPFWRYLVEFEGYTEEEAKAIQAESSAAVGDPYVKP